MAGSEITIIERELDRDYMPMLANILTQTPNLPAIAFRSAFLEQVSKNNLIACTRQSLFYCASSFSFAGILPGSFTGQGYILPFRDKKNNVVNAVPVIGYMGYNTMAARSGIGIEGMCIRKDDDYKIRMGSQPRIDHFPNLDKADAQIIGCWSQLVKMGYEARYSQRALGIKQILAIKAKSMGSRKEDSPWNDHKGPGFEAMSEKSVRRLQKRSIPLNAFLMADAMETLHDLGTPAWIAPSERSGVPTIITPQGEKHPPPPDKDDPPAVVMPPKNLKFVVMTGPKESRNCKDIAEWQRLMIMMIGKTKNIAAARNGNAQAMRDLADAGFEHEVQRVIDKFNEKEG